jgi:thiamine transport system ATP-binding protein
MSLEIDELTVSYPDFIGAYRLSVPEGAIVGLMGPSGGGKTTLLHAIAGFERVASGRVTFRGVDLTDRPPARRPVTILFQDHNLFGHLTAFDNVALGASPRLSLNEADRARVTAALEAVELGPQAGRRPGELSGGQRQRVALARALVMRRPVLLLDEPFGALDPGLRRAMVALVARLSRHDGMTVLMTSHTPEDMADVADQFVFVADGRVAESGTPTALLKPGRSPGLNAFFGI